LDYALQVIPYGLSLLLFFITDWFKFVKDSKEKWKFIAMTSMFGTLFPFLAIAQTEIDSSVTSILNFYAKHLGFGYLVFWRFERRQVWGVLIDFGKLTLVLMVQQ
jgi:tellurite resistance protein TehA-like permease